MISYFFEAIRTKCWSSVLNSTSFSASGLLLSYVLLAVCSTRRASVLICSPEARVMLSKSSFCYVRDC